MSNQLLHFTRIWKDKDTKKEHQAPCCVRWADVHMIEEDIDSGLQSWDYKGAITFIDCGDFTVHVVGNHQEYKKRWASFLDSAHGLLLSQQ